MLGQCYSEKKYNVVILAGGEGSRMGDSSEYLPKALIPLGSMRAIDWIIQRHANIAHQFIIGVCRHHDLVKNYLLGNYPNLNLKFSYEGFLKNPAISFAYCLDNVDSRYPTVLSFCDLLILDNFALNGDSIYTVDIPDSGNAGVFRQCVIDNKIVRFEPPIVSTKLKPGILGYFIFVDTIKLKAGVYNNFNSLNDLTDDIVKTYFNDKQLLPVKQVKKLFEFGTLKDLKIARQLWEKIY